MKFISHVLTWILAFTSLCSHACAADLDIRDEAEFRKCVPTGAKLEKIAGDLGFTEGCQWIPRAGGYLIFTKHAKHKRAFYEITHWSAAQEPAAPCGIKQRAHFNDDLHAKLAPHREDIAFGFDLHDLDDYATFGGKP